MSGKTPFERMVASQHDRLAVLRAARYEEARVTWLLKKFKRPRLSAALRRNEERETGRAVLTLRAFNDEFPTFPILLGASDLDGVRLHLDERAMMPALFKHFDQAPFVIAYERFYEAAEGRAEGRALGLVFPRKAFPQGWIIFDDGLEAVPYHGATFLYEGGTRKERHRLFVRPFQTMVEAIHREGHGWRPES